MWGVWCKDKKYSAIIKSSHAKEETEKNYFIIDFVYFLFIISLFLLLQKKRCPFYQSNISSISKFIAREYFPQIIEGLITLCLRIVSCRVVLFLFFLIYYLPTFGFIFSKTRKILLKDDWCNIKKLEYLFVHTRLRLNRLMVHERTMDDAISHSSAWNFQTMRTADGERDFHCDPSHGWRWGG